MKGIILAGGTGSRLYPLTKVTNKHLLPVGPFPMIYYPIFKIHECGIEEILIVSGKEHMGSVVNLLGSGNDFGLRFTYKIQDQPGGIAQALGLAEQFGGTERLLVILADNIFKASIRPLVERYRQQPQGAKIILKEVPDPERYGVAELQEGKITALEEKPSRPKSNYCVTGIYLYDPQVFEFIRSLKPSGRGELEITDVNRAYLEKGCLSYEILPDWWTDAGTFDSIYRANQYVKEADLAEIWKKLNNGRIGAEGWAQDD